MPTLELIGTGFYRLTDLPRVRLSRPFYGLMRGDEGSIVETAGGSVDVEFDTGETQIFTEAEAAQYLERL